MFIKYNPKNPHIKVVPIVSNGAAVAAGSVILTPGTNEISEKAWNSIKAHLATEIADGTIKPFSVPAKSKDGEPAAAKTLKDVPVPVASKIIAECSSKETLRAWFNDNLSDELALLVIKRMRVLNMDIDEIAGSTEKPLSDNDITIEDGGGTQNTSEKKVVSSAGSSGGKNNSKKNTGSSKKDVDGTPTPTESASGDAGNGGTENDNDVDDTPAFDDPNAKVD